MTALLDMIDKYITARVHTHTLQKHPGVVIHKVPGTRTYEYRLPIWDLREECVTCAGSGLDVTRPCTQCDGTGVVTHDEATIEGDRQ